MIQQALGATAPTTSHKSSISHGLWLVGPGGQHATLPGYMWPEGGGLGGDGPNGGWYRIPVEHANRLCKLWGNPLGESRRPFRQWAWGLQSEGKAIAVTIEATTVSTTVEGIHRRELVDLARIARHPDHSGVTRAMLRLWRDLMAPHWRGSDCWHDSPRAAVSYQLPGKRGDSNIYRFDGWLDMGLCKKAGKPGRSSWSNPSRTDDMSDGRKRLWMWPYDSETREQLQAIAAERKRRAGRSVC